MNFLPYFSRYISRIFFVENIKLGFSALGVENIEKNAVGGTVGGGRKVVGADCKSILEEGLKDQLNGPVSMII